VPAEAVTDEQAGTGARLARAVRLLGEAADVLAGLAVGDDLAAVAAAELAAAESRVRAATTRIETARLGMLPHLEDDGRWALDGSRTFAAWLARRDGITRRRANAEVRAATRLRVHLPVTARAALDGRVGVDELTAMVEIAPTSEARRAALAAPVTGVEVPVAGVGAPGEGDVGAATDTDGAAAAPTGEEYLLSFSGRHPIGTFQRLLRRFAHVADPEADERGYRQATEREFLDLAPTWGGYHVAGFLTTEHGQQVRTALDALMTPGTGGGVGADGAGTGPGASPGGGTGADGSNGAGAEKTASPAERRSVQQRRAQALADLARVALDGGLVSPGASVRPHVTVHVSWTELQRVLADADRRTAPDDAPDDASDHASDHASDDAPDGGDPGSGDGSQVSRPTGGLRRELQPRSSPGPSRGVDPPATDPGIDVRVLAEPETDYPTWADDTGPVPRELLAKIACDAEVTRVVFGPDSQVLDVGRARRTVTGQLRRAVVARDRHCTWPGCLEPPARCEVHHAVTHWADGGTTSVDNAALLCWHHHTVVDTTGVTMRWERGTWAFTDRHGRPVTATGASPVSPTPASCEGEGLEEEGCKEASSAGERFDEQRSARERDVEAA
jgi:hypothetical protein